ncbi:MAG: ATP-dependent DNA helicase RecG [Bacteroidales bacterium]|nr:ATP-dependent DNA helicase RecG [Bacteroidales bacterium]
MADNFLDTAIEYLKGVGPQRGEMLRKELNIFKFEDLLNYFPFRYVDRSKFNKVNEVASDTNFYQIKGKIRNIRLHGERRTTRMTATLVDETGAIELVWFQGFKWLKDKFKQEPEYVVFGKATIFNNRFNFTHPEIELYNKDENSIQVALQPFYNSSEKLKSKGLDSKGIGKLTKTLVSSIQGKIDEVLTTELIDKLALISRELAFINIHFPSDQIMLDKALRRFKFEEIFFIQLNHLKNKKIREQTVRGFIFPVVGDYFNKFYREFLPFELTNAQKRVIKEIRADLGSGKQMNRLLQGDVGSGKTLVALMSMLIAIDNGYQTCMMAPTEILANQHYNTIIKLLGQREESGNKHLDISVELLTGSTKSKQRRDIFPKFEDGTVNIIIGTHALIEDDVRFKNLGLVVIDEQHRFGVAQRAKLWKKSTTAPHILVMTATPIPRTLAMTFYGDLDVSVIDEMPPGRSPVKTYKLNDYQRPRLFKFLKDQINKGRQIYVVYPLINESETLDLKHLMEGYDVMANEFPPPEYAISIVHGQLKAAERDYEMNRFIKGITQIMIATTVIEVGVDIPNATVMVIESAQRFGLSQLHQLRGRVGRGADQSYCLLMTDFKMSSEAKIRIDTMVRTIDGFEIAEMDLHLRGPGDIEGTMQSGIMDLKLTDLSKDDKIIQFARNIASVVLEEDPMLLKPKNYCLSTHLTKLFANKAGFSRIS